MRHFGRQPRRRHLATDCSDVVFVDNKTVDPIFSPEDGSPFRSSPIAAGRAPLFLEAMHLYPPRVFFAKSAESLENKRVEFLGVQKSAKECARD